MDRRRIAVVGAGITGLTAAWSLQNSGIEVILFERRDHAGGSIKTKQREDWLLEYGPNTLQIKSRKVERFLENLDLDSQIVEANPAASNRYIVKNGELLPVPNGPIDLLRTELFSLRGRLRLMIEPFIRKGRDPDETLDRFVSRRLGAEMLNYAIDPFVAGVYAGVPEELVVRHAFPRLYHLEQRYGSLIAGSLRKRWDEKRAENVKTRLISFPDGLSTLPDKLAKQLTNINLKADVNRVEQGSSGWEVSTSEETFRGFDAVLMNIPLYRVNEQLLDGGGELLDAVSLAGYPPLSVVHTGYRKEQVKHPLDGFGFLVPSIEEHQILGSLFNSTLFPGRAPEDHHLLTTFVGGTRQPDLAGLESESIQEMVVGEHRRLLGLSGEPVLFEHIYWPRSIPQYTRNYPKVVKAILNVESLNPGLYFGGNFRGGIALPDCIENGLVWAEMLKSESGETVDFLNQI